MTGEKAELSLRIPTQRNDTFGRHYLNIFSETTAR